MESKRKFIWILTIILIFCMSTNVMYASEIEKLKTKEDVQNFLVQKVDTAWAKYDFFEDINGEDTSAFGKGKFFKLDLDQNGTIDLLINGKYLFAITDSCNGRFASHFIDRGTFMLDKYTLKNIVYKDKIPLLIVGKYNEYAFTKTSSSKDDSLILVFGDFYEYNSSIDDLKIKEIKISTSVCFGTCPVFKLMIRTDRTATYDAIQYNKMNGKFKAKIDSVSFAKLIETINYIKLNSLKDHYEVNWTDDQTVTLEIKFNDGLVKRISDYGKIGTLGLQYLYAQLFALRKTQVWK